MRSAGPYASPTIEQQRSSIVRVTAQYPFPEILEVPFDSTENIVRVVCAGAPVSARVLDYGAGASRTSAVLSDLGYRCFAVDDLLDDWVDDEARATILRFAEQSGVDYCQLGEGREITGEYDVIILADVIEHFHSSPRPVLLRLIDMLTPNGLLIISVPNAANIRKRLGLLFGRTNYPNFDYFYLYPGEWRGHVREYVADDLRRLCWHLSLNGSVTGVDNMLGRVPRILRAPYRRLLAPFPNLHDSLLLVARKPEHWTPTEQQFSKVRSSIGQYDPG